MVVLKSGFLLLFLHLIRSSFVESAYECAFSGNDFVTFSKDIIDGRMPSRFTLLGTNDQDHIDSFRIEVICNERQNQKSVLVTALRKQIQFNPSNATVDQVAQWRDVSIIIPPLRVDVLQERGAKMVNLNTGISVQYTPPNSGKIIIADDYTGTHNLSGACGNPWKTRRADPDDARHRLFKFLNDEPKKPIMPKKTPNPMIPTRYGMPDSNKMVPDFGKPNNRRNFPRQGKGVNNPKMNSKDPDDRFQDPRIYPNCYIGGLWRQNGSMLMTSDCSRIFICIDGFVTHRKSPGCSVFADCVSVRNIGICRCRPGFIGNGFTCVYIPDRISPKNRLNNVPHPNFASHITPVVPKKKLLSKVRPFLNPLKPRNKNSERQNPNGSGVGNDGNPIGKRPLTKTGPKNHQSARTQPDKIKGRQKPGTKVFDRPSKPFNRYDRPRQPGKNAGKVIKPLKQNRKPFKKNRGDPRNMENNKGILPNKNTFPVRNRLFPVRNPIIANGRRIPPRKIPNNFRSHGKEKPKKNPAVPMSNREKLLMEIIKHLLDEKYHRNQDKSPKPASPFGKRPKKLSPDDRDPTNRLTNPKQTDLRSRRPHKKDPQNRKRPHLKPLGYKKPTRSDIKRVTDIIRSLNKKVTNPPLPTHSSLFTTTIMNKNTFSASPARMTSTVSNYINPVSMTSVDSQLFSSSSSSSSTIHPSGIPLVETQLTRPTSVDPLLFDLNRRLLPNGDEFIPSVNNMIRKKPVMDNNITNKPNRYPTVDGTIDGLLIEPPSEWPRNRVNSNKKPNQRLPNRPPINRPNHRNKKPNERLSNRPAINRPNLSNKNPNERLSNRPAINRPNLSNKKTNERLPNHPLINRPNNPNEIPNERLPNRPLINRPNNPNKNPNERLPNRPPINRPNNSNKNPNERLPNRPLINRPNNPNKKPNQRLPNRPPINRPNNPNKKPNERLPNRPSMNRPNLSNKKPNERLPNRPLINRPNNSNKRPNERLPNHPLINRPNLSNKNPNQRLPNRPSINRPHHPNKKPNERLPNRPSMNRPNLSNKKPNERLPNRPLINRPSLSNKNPNERLPNRPSMNRPNLSNKKTNERLPNRPLINRPSLSNKNPNERLPNRPSVNRPNLSNKKPNERLPNRPLINRPSLSNKNPSERLPNRPSMNRPNLSNKKTNERLPNRPAMDRPNHSNKRPNEKLPNRPFINRPNNPNKKPNERLPNRPSMNTPEPKPKSKLDELIRKCKLNGSGCSKINAMVSTGTPVPVTIPGFLYPVSISINPNSVRWSTHAVTVPYSTKKASTNKIESKFTTNYVIINTPVQQPTTDSGIKTEKPKVNVPLQPPPSIEEEPGKTETKREKCDDDNKTGLRYKLMKKIKQSVEEVQT